MVRSWIASPLKTAEWSQKNPKSPQPGLQLPDNKLQCTPKDILRQTHSEKKQRVNLIVKFVSLSPWVMQAVNLFSGVDKAQKGEIMQDGASHLACEAG